MRRILVLVVSLLFASSALIAQQRKEIRDPAEYNSYVGAIQVPNAQQRASALEDFLSRYPYTVVREDALEQLMGAYQEAGNGPKAIETANRILEVNPNNRLALALTKGVVSTPMTAMVPDQQQQLMAVRGDTWRGQTIQGTLADPLRRLVITVCRGEWLPVDLDPSDPTRPEEPAIKRLRTALRGIGNRKVLVAVSSNNEINSWETDIDSQHSLVCIPSELVRFMGNEDEIAFVIAHEIGHALDDACRRTAGVRRTVSVQVECEVRADEIGYNLLRRAGYSPFAAAGAFGRIEMYSGDTQTGIAGWFRQMASDHPITPKRIQHMRELLIREMQANSIAPR